MYRHKAEVSAYAYAYACVVSSLCPVYFSSPAILRLPPTTLAILSQPTHTGRRVSRPVKSRSYRHSGRTDSTHRCCYECYQRSQFTEDNAEPSFLPGINSLCQFTVPPPGHLCQPHLCGRGLRQRPANQSNDSYFCIKSKCWYHRLDCCSCPPYLGQICQAVMWL